MLAVSNLVLAAGLALLGLAQGMPSLAVAWIVLGIGMAMGLYDPAFAALTRLYGRAARAPITGITLIAGFASTIGWPASAWFEHAFGWREACFIWAALNLLVAMPLNWWAIPPAPPLPDASETSRDSGETGGAARRDADPGLFLLRDAGSSPARSRRICRACCRAAGATEIAAIAAGALVGPAQVGARLVEFGLLRSFHPLISARIAAVLHPLGAVCLVVFGPVAAPVLRDLPRRRQRHDHDRQGHAAAGDLRAGRVRAAQRPPIGADRASPKRARRFCSACCSTGSGSTRCWSRPALCLAAFASLLLLRPVLPADAPLGMTRSRRQRLTMPYASLRDFIGRLEAAGRLVRVAAPVSPFLEMTEIQTRLLAEGGPAVLFENVVREDGGTLRDAGAGQPVRHRRAGRLGHGPRARRNCAKSARRSPFLKQPEPPGGWREALEMLPLLRTVMAMRPRTVAAGAVPGDRAARRRDRSSAAADPDLLAGRAGAADHLAAGRHQGPRRGAARTVSTSASTACR